MTPSVRAAIRSFICANFIVVEDAFGDADSLLEREVMDSTGILELVSWLEQTFGVQVGEHEIDPANLDSVEAIAAFLERKGLTAVESRS
jgi:acyl carrier protein